MKKTWIGALALAAIVSGQEQVTISRAISPGEAYKAVLDQVKKDGLDVKLNSSLDAGIETEPTENGGVWKTTCYYRIAFIPEDGKTTVRVAAYEMKRVWGAAGRTQPKVNVERSRSEAFLLQRELGW